jgi:isochorismate hydrolase
MPHVTSVHRLDRNRSGLLVVDLQERLVPVIPSGDQVVRQTERLLKAADLLSVPSASTVQYPKGLGNLVAPLNQWFDGNDNSPEEKLDFSSAVCRQSLDTWTEAGRDQIVVAGIETHVCIMQTVLDLMAEGCFAYVVAEAVAARHRCDHETAMNRMRDAGATIISAESVMFEWLGTADHPQFKEMSQLIKAGV